MKGIDLEAGDIRAAASLLTRLPLGGDHEAMGARAAASVWAYPLVGAGLGLAGGAVFAGASLLGIAPLAAAALALAVLLLMTGALHEDGLADTADGLGGGWTPARRLEIMKDSRIGAYGAAALCLSLLIRAACLAALEPLAAIAALTAAEAASRGWIGLAMARIPAARAGGMSAGAGAPPEVSARLGLGLGLVIALVCGAPLAGLAALAGLLAVRLFARVIGGQTGDTLGAGQQVAVIAALLAA